MIGVVGSARNGCDGPIDSGNLEFSSVLFGCTVFGVTVFGAVVGGPDLYEIKECPCECVRNTIENLKHFASSYTHAHFARVD